MTMLNISDIDVWMWMRKLSPKSRPTNATLRAPLISLFSKPGQWSNLVDLRECLTPQADTLRASITTPFPIKRQDISMIPLSEIARWLARYGGLTPDRMPHIEAYVACHLSKAVHNSAALEGQKPCHISSMAPGQWSGHARPLDHRAWPHHPRGRTVHRGSAHRTCGYTSTGPRPPPAPYTDVPMEDAENPDDWVPNP
jgi:hypothetical protein